MELIDDELLLVEGLLDSAGAGVLASEEEV